jgi:hypothetical protein
MATSEIRSAPHFELFSTSFCAACSQTRAVLERAIELVPGATLVDHDLAREPRLAEAQNIEHSPTTIIRDANGVELYRAVGVPTLPQVLVAAARAIDIPPEQIPSSGTDML